MNESSDTVSKRQHLHRDVKVWRHDIHKHPELGFQEERTADKVAGLLTEFGLDVHTGIGTTGVVGVLKRGVAEHGIGMRADIDALPIQEANNFGSTRISVGKSRIRPGVIH